MTERVARLRQESLDRRPTLSSERAELMTAFYRDAPAAPLPILRALSFQYLTAHKALCILPGELIVGERGPAPKATPTYPELCCHTLVDLDVLDSREKISFAVDQRARDAYRDEVIPYWRERSMRHRMFQELPDAWKHAYEAGVFTEFMEQRAPGHTVADGEDLREGARRPAGRHRPRTGGARRPPRPRGVRQAAAAEGHADGRGCRDHASPAGTPTRPRASRRRRPTRSARRSSSRSPPTARGCPSTRRARSGRRCSRTGSSTWASSPS